MFVLETAETAAKTQIINGIQEITLTHAVITYQPVDVRAEIHISGFDVFEIMCYEAFQYHNAKIQIFLLFLEIGAMKKTREKQSPLSRLKIFAKKNYCPK